MSSANDLLIKRQASLKEIDLPVTIVVYAIVIMLGIGMCFCLKRANRLLPDRMSFPLHLRSTDPNEARRRRNGYDINDEEQGDPESREGLLERGFDEYDGEEEEENRYRDTRKPVYAVRDTGPRVSEDDSPNNDEEFGAMQGAKKPVVFNIAGDDDDEEFEEPSDNDKRNNPVRLP